jgi:hypothetical protein
MGNCLRDKNHDGLQITPIIESNQTDEFDDD